MENNVILNKVSTVERCLTRIKDVYDNNRNNLTDFTKQDSIVLNLQRACEACIDLAMHIVATKQLGIPQNSWDAFTIIEQEGIIPSSLSNRMKAMVGFRNVAVHDYQEINIQILEKVIENHLIDFTSYTKAILTHK
ncbi:type VII toxin-antitoxin system HepT family RNase toxin [Halalkalibacter hemicellulosilyticus]|uniref:DUF86 domain-containing protein n=1 Tax=Halalkalibacter hemicellulosilyticusJCM 9152 TaxID=1236971 RepID=W4QH14_9BACI|nr:DUF86 domain-containing protein [Halalkalibacter hemicellulosilyticus]GAE31376.1 hypothetical protein JCM9152_2842 [Halalkalibacter hemicellulosilyticusJCM 9152]